jgi:hypothetical protein
MQNISKQTKLVRHSNAVAAGVTTITPSAGIDTKGFAGCLFIVHWGAIVATGVQSIECHSSTDDGAADAYTALLGSKVTVADTDDNKITYLDIYHPRERYLKCIVNRATANSTVDAITALLYDPVVMPTTHDATTVSGGELHVAEAAGTA